MMEKRGQAAMEFLMTYGWAILAAIIAIAVLAWFGVFSPGRYVSSMCTISAPFGCEEYALSTGSMRFVIRNGIGDQVTISSVQVKGCGSDSTSRVIPDGGLNDTTVTCSPVLTGNKFRGDIIINYTKGASGLVTQTAKGTISGSI
jgi:uncharacterized protein (UPF0333 family)